MSIEAIIAVSVAIALGMVNIAIKVNEAMNKKKGNNKAYPCAEHTKRIDELSDKEEKTRSDFNASCLLFTEKITRVTTLVETILEKIDNFSNGR